MLKLLIALAVALSGCTIHCHTFTTTEPMVVRQVGYVPLYVPQRRIYRPCNNLNRHNCWARQRRYYR